MISAQGPSDNCPPTSGGEVAGGKRGNPSQDRSRGVAGIRKSVKNLSEVCQFPCSFALGFGTKSMRYRDATCKPEWYDENTFVPWDKFKGCQRPDNFNGNWAALQYDLLKAAYLPTSAPRWSWCAKNKLSITYLVEIAF